MKAALEVVKNQNGGKHTEYGGLVDRKHMMIDTLENKNGWLEFAERVIEYVEEIQPAFAAQLQRAQKHPDDIEPVYPIDEDRRVAHSAYKLLNQYGKETAGKNAERTEIELVVRRVAVPCS